MCSEDGQWGYGVSMGTSLEYSQLHLLEVANPVYNWCNEHKDDSYMKLIRSQTWTISTDIFIFMLEETKPLVLSTVTINHK